MSPPLARIRDLDQAAAFAVSQPQRLASGNIFFLKQAADEDVARLWVREADTGAFIEGVVSRYSTAPAGTLLFE